jgi:DNA-binding MarR family transcriptional regulator
MGQLFHLRWVLDPGQVVPGLGATVSEALAMGHLAHGEQTQRDLAEHLGLEKSTVSRLVDGMIRKGWVEKARDPGNRRYQKVALTADGARAAGQIATAMHERHIRWLAALTEQERKAVTVGLTALLRVMKEDFDNQAR